MRRHLGVLIGLLLRLASGRDGRYLQAGRSSQVHVRGDERRADLFGQGDVESVGDGEVSSSAPGQIHQRSDLDSVELGCRQPVVGVSDAGRGGAPVELGSSEDAGDLQEVVLGYPPLRSCRQLREQRFCVGGVQQEIGAGRWLW